MLSFGEKSSLGTQKTPYLSRGAFAGQFGEHQAHPSQNLCSCVSLPGGSGKKRKGLSEQSRALPAGKSGLWCWRSACQVKYQLGDVTGMQFKE